jgi:hypothetical protein
MKQLVYAAVLTLVGACAHPIPPGAPVEREIASVDASFGRTWDAVIDQFAAENIPIRTIERASGFIATETQSVPLPPYDQWKAPNPLADCGRDANRLYTPPSEVVYNVVVRGDSTRSTVHVTARWMASGGPRPLFAAPAVRSDRVECSSRGRWEYDFEQDVKARAQARKVAR